MTSSIDSFESSILPIFIQQNNYLFMYKIIDKYYSLIWIESKMYLLFL